MTLDRYRRAGLTFDVTDTGPVDGRVVIALHGFPEDRQCWSALGSRLSDAGNRVLAPDQRGYSPAARPASRRAYAMLQLAEDVLALADAAGAQRFDVIGHDWGAAVAWDLAARRPDRVRSLVALSTPHPRAFRDSLMRSNQLLRSWYMLFFQLPVIPETILRSAGPEPMTKDGLDPDTARRYASRFSQRGAMTGPLNWYRAIPFSANSPSPLVTVSTLYAWGDRDRFLSRYAADRTAHYVSGPYRFEVLEGMPHWLPTAAADQLAPMVLEHLGAVAD